jgi:PAS domain S-box-containing protein
MQWVMKRCAQWLAGQPGRIALALNGFIVVLVVAGVVLHLLDHRQQALQSMQVRAVNIAQSQALLIGEQVQKIDFMLAQLATQLNVARTLAPKASNTDQTDVRVHDLLRQFLNMVPNSVDVLLIREDGGVLAASHVLAEWAPLADYCVPLQSIKALAVQDSFHAFRAPPVGRCPPLGTLVFAKAFKSTGRPTGDVLWLLVNPDLFQRVLAQDVPGISDVNDYQIMARNQVLLEKSDNTPRAGKGLPYPDFQSPAVSGGAEVSFVNDAQAGRLLTGVSQNVTGTPINVQLVYSAQDAIAPAWTRYAWMWTGTGLVFLLVWLLASVLIVRMLKRHQQTLKSSDERLERSLDLAETGVWEWDIPAGTLTWSKRVAPMFGYAEVRLETSYASYMAAVHPDDRAAVEQTIQRCLQNGLLYSIKYRVVWPDGTVRWLSESGNVVRASDGSPLKMTGVVQDITAPHAADQQLKLLEKAVANLNDIVLITEAEPFEAPGPRIVFVNDAFVRRTGYSREEVIGKTPRILQGVKTQRAELARIGVALRKWEPVRAELINYTKAGEEFWLELDIVPVADDTGWFTHWVAVERDITERKQTQHALQASLQEKVALLNEVHHRVKNNLQVITSMLRLEAGRSDHPATKSVLKDMQDRIRSLALLHESIYRSGTFAAIDLGHYLKQIATQSFRSLQASSSPLELRLDLDTVQIGLDQATPCGLLVSELLSNCFKHAFPDGRTGEVCIKLKPAEISGQWQLQVSDTGVGLPDDFETRREKSLGLQLVDSLASQLGGSLQAGPGAVFAVTFTVNAPAPLQIVV